MLENPRVKDRMSLNDSIFSHMTYDFGSLITSSSLDRLFYSKYAGKNTSQLVELMEFDDNGKLTSESLTTLAAIMVEIFKSKWDKQKAIFDIEYSPIYNYLDEWEDTSHKENVIDGTELQTNNTTDARTLNLEDETNRTDNLKSTRTDNLGSSSTRTDNLTEEEDSQAGDTQSKSLYGFNSSNAVPSDSSNGSNTNHRETTNTGTQSTNTSNTGTQMVDDTGTQKVVTTNTGTDSLVRTGTIQNKTDNEEISDGERSGVHRGNIGNITTQKMLREEIELWRWNFVQEILNDVKSQLTIPIYLG